jgi:DNA transposition AAA+ family ATPase
MADATLGRNGIPTNRPFMESGTRLVSSDGLRSVSFYVRQAVMAWGICLVSGNPGLGKTFATREILHALFDSLPPDTVLREERFPKSPSAKRIAERLHYAVTGVRLSGHTEEAITEQLLLALMRPTILFIDEAQNLTAHGMHYLRHLWDDPDTRVCLVLAGAHGTFQLIRKDRTLRSRIYAHAALKPLDLGKEQAVDLIRQLHPVWSKASPEIIKLVDTNFARGNFRSWVVATRWATAYCEQEGITTPNDDVIDEVLDTVRSLSAEAV